MHPFRRLLVLTSAVLVFASRALSASPGPDLRNTLPPWCEEYTITVCLMPEEECPADPTIDFCSYNNPYPFETLRCMIGYCSNVEDFDCGIETEPSDRVLVCGYSWWW